ncbi:MAG: hypothetical protein LBR44_03070 [Clostridiales Family XIII bacterium]|jgi:hypothetical protein|nr:hypothetical protein [Clostridiales Family XIII bacterium]
MKAPSKINEYVVGGWLLICGGLLLSIACVLIALLPQIPSEQNEILDWIQQVKWSLSMSDELFCFSLPLLVPSIIILYRATRTVRPISSLIACSSFMIAAVGLINVLGAAGRLVYPVNTISITADNAVMAASNLFAGLHFTAIVLAFSIAMFGYAMHNVKLFIISVAIGILQLFGTYYAGITPTWLLVIAVVAFFAWTIIVGVRLIRQREKHHGDIT